MNSHRPTRYRFSKGFTAIELLVVIAILGILAAMAAPAMGDLVARYQTRSTAEQLSTLILRAQTEALRRNGFVRLEKSSATSSSVNSCATDNNWSCGVALAVDEEKKGVWSNLSVLEVPRGVQVQISGASSSNLPFDRWGRVATVTQPNFVLSKNNVTSANLAVCVDTTGRVRILKLANLSTQCP